VSPGSSFVVGQWVRGPSFYGRDDVIQEILHGNRNSLWVVATRRTGKTSLLREVELRAWSEGAYLPLFLDLQGSETADDLNRELEDALFDVEDRLEDAGLDSPALIGADLFASLEAMRRGARRQGRRLLLLLDESEALLGIRERDARFLNRLRHFLQSKADVRSVLTSTLRLAALTEARDDTSPFLHGFTPPIYLRGLAAPAALALIQQENLPLDQRPQFELEQAEKIRAQCDDHPYLLQLVCKRTVELGEVDEALAQVAADPMVSYFFAVDFEMLAAEERRVVELLAASSGAHSGSIAERIAAEGSEMNTALRRLESLGYLRRESDGRFVLANFFFRRWLEARRSAAPAPDQPTLSLPRARIGADSWKDLASGGKLGKYELGESIGRGGFAVVYKAHDPDLDRTVAVKACLEVDPAVRARFAREARIVAKLVHPNIVTVHDFGFQGDIAFLVQEYLDGEDLREVISHGSLPCSRAVPYLLQIAGAMAHAHRHGIVHRDLKPGNVMILRSGEAKVLDFGLAKARGDETLTADGMALGTIAYLSPEMLAQQPVDARSDVFAFGVLGYELLSARRPFVGDSLSAVMFAILNTRPVPLRELVPECPSQLEGLLMSCLEKEPDHRPAGFEPILETLTGVQRANAGSSAAAASAGS
jgi:hypothetical protein